MHRPGIIGGRPHHGGAPYVGPLDIVPGAVVAYWQQAMTGGSTANAITIKRDSDDATHTFPLVNNTVDVAAVSAFLGGANPSVTEWLDQSGNDRTFVVSSPVTEPGWSASVIGGKPGLTGTVADTEGFHSVYPALFPSGAATIFVVSGLGAEITFAVGADARGGFVDMQTGGAVSGHPYLDMYDGTNEAGGYFSNATTDAVHIFEGAWEFGNSVFMVDGVALDQEGTNDFGGPVGSISSTDAFLNISNVTTVVNRAVLAILPYSRLLSNGERLAVRQIFAAAYGITLP